MDVHFSLSALNLQIEAKIIGYVAPIKVVEVKIKIEIMKLLIPANKVGDNPLSYKK
ncbi:MAG: hypothetical protein ACD_79C01161G0001 [uncultured bacterium]|nr:MAG: hypothetical protein ACD_79C01161G0001 [uncultured bacterium]